MKTLRVVLNNQLSEDTASLQGIDLKHDVVFMCEAIEDYTYVKHHKKKIAFFLSAMRHFAQRLRDNGYRVMYVPLNDPDSTGSLVKEIIRACATFAPDRVVVTWPAEYRLVEDLDRLQAALKVPVEIKEDTFFLASRDEFAQWADGRKQLRMEFFYREMRKKYGILMHGSEPVGGQWNYDAENRKFPSEPLKVPAAYTAPEDKITQEVLALVSTKFKKHFGDLEPFYFAVTREQALDALHLFIKERLKNFGDYQDAMIQGEPWMYHSHLSFYINVSLLHPLECVHAAEKAYKAHKASLNAVEGFIRQIIGWREYVRGIYWLKMPEYKKLNFFDAQRPLPAFYWNALTKMNCLKQAVEETKKNAYAHHIQRLMVLGNFALIAGIHPDWVNEWYLIVYADAFEWVELPNVTGMTLFADGGCLASKPYASSGAYINKMSDYCKSCVYSVKEKVGPKACPFNYLYWDFLMRNRSKLGKVQRLSMIYATLDKMDSKVLRQMRSDAHSFLEELE